MTGLRLLLLALVLPAIAQAADLSGKWRGDDGGDYYLVHREASLIWYAEQDASNPAWSNVFDGRVNGERIRGNWTDVPKGRTRAHGRLELSIRDGGNTLVIINKSGGYGGNRLTRVDTTVGPVPMKPHPVKPSKPARVMPPAASAKPMQVKPMQVQPVVKEDCIGFNWKNAARTQVDGRWKIVDGSHWLFDFEQNKREASQALRIIKRYRLNNSCFVGRPDPSLSYLLSGDEAPSGALKGEDCIAFNPGNIALEQHGGRWKIVEGSHWMFDFGSNEAEARQALAIIKKHGFTHSCYVGRPDPSFSYLRK